MAKAKKHDGNDCSIKFKVLDIQFENQRQFYDTCCLTIIPDQGSSGMLEIQAEHPR